MKTRIILTMACFILTYMAFGQTINIPDPNFENYLLNNYDDDFSGTIEVNEVNTVSQLNIEFLDIFDISGIEYFTNLQILNAGFNYIDYADLSSNNLLQKIDFTGNYDLYDIDLYSNTNLKEAYLGFTNLSYIDLIGNPNLEVLNLEGNYLTSIDLSYTPNLEVLNLEANYLTSIDLSFTPNLEELYLNGNNISSIDLSYTPNLKDLTLANNNLNTIDLSFTPNLEYLSIGDDTLLQSIDFQSTVLNMIPNVTFLSLYITDTITTDLTPLPNLQRLGFFPSNLTSIDLSTAPNLEELIVFGNNYTSIDLSYTPNLEQLSLWNNSNLSSINLSNTPNLNDLILRNNSLSSIDLSFTPNLTRLVIDNNNLSSIDISQTPLLNRLRLSNNNLLNINAKNGFANFQELAFDGNPNLSYICVDDFNINQFQNLATQYGYTNCNVGTYCNFSPGGDVFEISGNVTYDQDSNGSCDANDSSFANLKLDISDGTTQGSFFSNQSGEYSIPVNAGNYNLTPQPENPNYYSITPTTTSVDFPSASSPFLQDYCLTSNGTFNDLEVILVPVEEARPGFETDYKLVYKNKGTTTLSGTVSLSFDDNYMNLTASVPASTSQTTGNLTWDYTNLSPGESREISFTMLLNTPTDGSFPLNGDDILNYTSNINSASSDETPTDNTFNLNQIVVNSFDPNDIRCLEGNSITPEKVGDFVHYLIRFENTGTASAVNVVIKDVLDTTKFDINTLVPLDASHDHFTRIVNGNEAEFIFENIMLPFDDDNNDGFVLFKIKTLSTLIVGDSFDNTAEIYFDFNFPIITNTETTAVEEELSISENVHLNFSIYPNPTSGIINVSEFSNIDEISILDLNGRVLKTISDFRHSQGQINFEELSKGIYFLNIVSNNQNQVIKFIKN